MPHTLLLADDSVTIQRVIELTFADEDVQVVAVSDGDQAIEQLNTNPPDIVLADIGMPGKSGYEVAQYIRQSPRLQHIPIVLLTGAFEPVDQERANEAGCDGVLAKPFEPQLVIGRVRELLARSSRKAEPGSAPAARPAPPAPAPVAAPVAPAAAGVPPAPVAATSNDYFDKLDAAFATLTTAPAPPAPQLTAIQGAPPQAVANEIDWFASQLNPPAADDLPLTTFEAPSVADDLNLTPEVGVEVPEAGAEVRGAEVREAGAEVRGAAVPGAVLGAEVPGAHAPQHPVQHSAPEHPAPHQAPQHPAPRHPVVLPSIADAFAAILAAEQTDRGPAVSGWPVSGSSSAPSGAPLDIEDIVERVTRRVIDRLGDAVIRDAVADATSLIAERLVIEEIERIKSSIK